MDFFLPSFTNSHQWIKSKQTIIISGLYGSSQALVLAQLLAKEKRNYLIVCDKSSTAHTLVQELHTCLTFFPNTVQVLLFPSWEISPYSKLAPNPTNRLQRLRCLNALHSSSKKSVAVIAPIQAITQPTLSPTSYKKRIIPLQPGSVYEIPSLEEKLQALGYTQADLVEDPGTYAIRGGIMDIYSCVEPYPIRLDFMDNEIESIRLFNPISQRSQEKSFLNIAHIGPTREIELFPEEVETARSKIRAWCDQNHISRANRERLNNQLKENIITPEMDFLIPFFSKTPGYLWEYFSSDSLWTWVSADDVRVRLLERQEKLKLEYEMALTEQSIIAPNEEISLDYASLVEASKKFQNLRLEPLDIRSKEEAQRIHLKITPNNKVRGITKRNKTESADFDKVTEYIEELLELNYSIFFMANSKSQLDRLSFLLAQKGIPNKQLSPKEMPQKKMLTMVLGTLESGFQMDVDRVVCLTEDEIFGAKKHSEKQRTRPKDFFSKHLAKTSLDNLFKDDFLVHIEHGIGKYKGLIKLITSGIPGDYVHIEYAGKDRLYLPIYRLEQIQKYIGPADSRPPVNKLGSQHFVKAKSKAKAAVKDIAASLLKLYAQRASVSGYAFPEPDDEYKKFEACFPYDETPDQLQAIEETIKDMCTPKPMDRLICGDVGYGKTEVAMRAAFLAAYSGKQVVILVPTTILAEQHLYNFKIRFQSIPFVIESLSRFKKQKEQKVILEQLKNKKIDIIIGTHRLLSKDVAFKDLGLLVIDEEQRFGVENKERLKKFRLSADVLTLTATPIPRTLHLSLVGMRDISIIHTPPAERQSIRTYLAEFDKEIIKKAIIFELSRGGQVFFIHNRIQSMPIILNALKEILPKIKIAVANGTLPETQLEKIMTGFYKKEFDVLLSTAIVENGLDIPNANTIIVNRADAFGLSQLYQIRGRVGRSKNRAYAYLLTPKDITPSARNRLQTLQQHTALGSSFSISSRDLELRGSGDIVGGAQSGHVTSIGYDMYIELLNDEISSLKGEEKESKENIEINSSFPAYFPEEYISSPSLRLSTYKQLSSLNRLEEIEEGKKELEDRYGTLPQTALGLLWLLKTKIILQNAGFQGLNIGKEVLTLKAGKEPKIDTHKLLDLIARRPKEFNLQSESKLIIRKKTEDLESGFNTVQHLLHTIAINP